jgi:hypothetical protein
VRVPLSPPPGLVSDDTTFSSEGRWEDGNNARFVRGRPQTIGGWEVQFNSTLTGVCRSAIAWTEQSAGINIAFGTHSALEVYVSGALYDITPSGLSSGSIDATGVSGGWGTGNWGSGTWSSTSDGWYPRYWSLATFGAKLLANPRGGGIYQWANDPGTDAAALSNAPTQVTAMLVTPQRQVLAIGCVDSTASFDPLCVRGSEVEDANAWTPAADNTSFEDKLEGGGRLITGRLVGDYVALWSDNALYMGEYTGNLAQLYRWQMIETGCGIVGPGAVAVYKGRALWMSPDGQFRTWQPGYGVDVIPCPIRLDMFDNADTAQISKVIATTITQWDEVWWFYPDSRDATGANPGENSRYLALCLSEEEPTWFRGQLARTAFIDAGVQTNPMGVSYAGVVYKHEYERSADWYIKTADQYLNNAEQCVLLKGVWPDFENQDGDVSLTVYVRPYPQSTATTKGPYTLSEGGQKKDFMAQGRVASLKISGAAGTYARIGKPTFEATPTGRK